MKLKKQSYLSDHLSYEEQLQKFLDRGMQIKNKDYCILKLKSINYYKLKEFAIPFYKNINDTFLYSNIFLEKVIKRFYQDKNIRMALLYAIEKVEISFKNQIAFLLGSKFGAFGYLDFKNWIDKNEYCKHYTKIKEKQFKDNLKLKSKRTFNPFVKDFFNNYSEEYLPIWLVIEVLTFGDVLDLYEHMMLKDKIAIANNYNCTTSELKSWLEHLKLIRNMSAHNAAVIDIKFKTTPIIRKEWKEYLYNFKGTYTNRISNTLVIVKYLLYQINPQFPLIDLRISFEKLIKNNDDEAKMYGLASADLHFLNKL